jgi:hypothetical protein
MRPVVDLLVEQIETSDFVLVNKVDLMPGGVCEGWGGGEGLGCVCVRVMIEGCVLCVSGRLGPAKGGGGVREGDMAGDGGMAASAAAPWCCMLLAVAAVTAAHCAALLCVCHMGRWWAHHPCCWLQVA